MGGGHDGAEARPARRARLRAAAHYLPETVRSSIEIEEMVAQASDGFVPPPGIVEQLSGIRTRRVSALDEQSSDLAARAALLAMSKSGIQARDVDLVIFAACSQDMLEPATANIVQEKIGTHCPVFDIKNACNSFMNGIEVADALIRTGTYRTVLVTAGETPSRAIRFAVRNRKEFRDSFPGYTLGDAGSAVILQADDSGAGFFYSAFQTESQFWHIATLPGGGSIHPRGDEWTYIAGNGTELCAAFRDIGEGLLTKALAETSTRLSHFSRILCHQVTMPFLHSFLDRTGICEKQLVMTVPELGNIAAASVGVQMSLALQRGDIRTGTV